MEVIEPFPYQLEGASFLAKHPQALCADDMGLGKSAQAIRAADMVGAFDILVLCPASVRVNWEREFERFSPMDRPCSVIFTGSDRILERGVVVCSYDLLIQLAPKFKKKNWDLVILDEAHFLKERTAKRTKAVYGRGSNTPGIASSAKRVWRLSGTPAPNWADELWTHLHSAGIVTDSYWDFTFRYCKGFDSTYGYKITGHKNVDELKALLAQFMIRRTKEEVMKDLPRIIFSEMTVERSEVQLDPFFYDQIKSIGIPKFMDNMKVCDQSLRGALEAVAKTKHPNEDRLSVIEGMSASMATLRRYIGLAKLPAILDIIEAELKSGQLKKVVLFGVHQPVIESARERLAKYGAVTLYGLTPPIKRQQNIDKFVKNPKCRVFIGNIQAAGVGIDGLQKVCCNVEFLEQDWTPGGNAQAAMRVHRIGQTHVVRVRVWSLHKSVDELVQQTLTLKARELCRIF